jgi:nucleotidyltransferase/DNA polymerase involved in DNA repair
MLTYPPSVPPKPCFLALCVDAFSAQVLASWQPSLMGQPFVVVRQTRNGHKTLVHACSAEAAAMGVEPGMPLPIVERRFPGVRPVQREERLEGLAREDLFRVLNNFTPDFRIKEEGSAILDLTGTPSLREMSPQLACEDLSKRIFSALGFRHVSMGLAATKVGAQILARKARPDRILSAPDGKEQRILMDMPPSCLPGLSPGCRANIRKYAITTLGQLFRLGRETLITHFGKEGEKLHAMVSGLDLETTQAEEEMVEAETILQRDANDTDLLHRNVRLTVDQLVFRMRKKDASTNRFTLEIQYADNKSARRSFNSDQVTQAFGPIADLALKTFDALLQRRVALKTIRLYARKPKKATGQVDLFWTQQEHKQEAIGRALDRIRTKHDFKSVVSGSNVRLN